MTTTIGAFDNVPNPGSPVASPWAQDVTTAARHVFASAAALAAQWPAAPDGAHAYLLDTGRTMERRAGVWVLPRHPLGVVTRGLAPPTAFAATAPNQLSITFAAEPNRVYRCRAWCPWHASVAGTVASWLLSVGGTPLRTYRQTASVIGGGSSTETADLWADFTSTVAVPSCAFVLGSSRAAGTGTVSPVGNWQWTVEDVGASEGVPALAIATLTDD